MADRAAGRLAAVRRALDGGGGAATTTAAAVVAGGCVLDVVATPSTPARPGGSVPGVAAATAGGVGLNLARALAALQAPSRPPVRLVSVVGDDAAGRVLLAAATASGVDAGAVRVDVGARTPLVVTLITLATGDGAASVADVGAVEAGLEAGAVVDAVRAAAAATRAPVASVPLVVDANLRADVIAALSSSHTITLFEPVSEAKAARAVAAGLRGAALATPNAAELVAMARAVGWVGGLDAASLSALPLAEAAARLAPAARALFAARVAAAVLVTVGPAGAAFVGPADLVSAAPLLPALAAAAAAAHTAPPSTRLSALLCPAAPAIVRNTAGAGDALAAGALVALLEGAGAGRAVAAGCAAAAQAVASASAAPQLDRGEAARVAVALEKAATWVDLPGGL